MKKIEKILKKLKTMGVTAVKQSTEDEGSTFDDIILMRKMTKKIKIKLNVKVGGCEAKNDIFFCKRNKIDGIVAPMVESEYALTKFVQCARIDKKKKLYFNVETISAVKNLSKMISAKNFKYINGIVFGRSDLAGSLNKSKNFVNSKKIFNLIEKCILKTKKKVNKNFIFKLGGSITPKSQKFIKFLFDKKFLNFIETRNIEIKLTDKSIENLYEIIPLAFQFEIEWLKIRAKKIKKIDQRLAIQYNKRILEIDERLK